MVKPAIWDRLREIADQAERASQRVLSEETEHRLAEYRAAQLDDPLDVLVRVPKPTTWQLEALRLIASGVAADDRGGGPWSEFLRRTKQNVERGEIDEELEELNQYVEAGYNMRLRLNRLGLAVLADMEDQA